MLIAIHVREEKNGTLFGLKWFTKYLHFSLTWPSTMSDELLVKLNTPCGAYYAFGVHSHPLTKYITSLKKSSQIATDNISILRIDIILDIRYYLFINIEIGISNILECMKYLKKNIFWKKKSIVLKRPSKRINIPKISQHFLTNQSNIHFIRWYFTIFIYPQVFIIQWNTCRN